MKNKKTLIIVIGALLLIALLAGGFIAYKSHSAKVARGNVYNLAKIYAERGEYDRALSLLDTILIKEADDEIALDMLNQIIEMKKAASEGREVLGFTNLKFDSSEFAKIMQKSISAMEKSVEKALAESNKHAEENKKTMQDMLKLQEESQKAEADRRAEEEKKQAQKEERELEKEKLAAEKERIAIEREKAAAERERIAAEKAAKAAEQEEERKAQEAAIAEQKRIAEEKRKAEEAELAKKNEKLKKQLDDVNEEIQKGDAALATGNFDEAIKHFEKASSMMPAEAGLNLIAAKESQIAQSLYEASLNSTDKAEKEKLMAKAVEMAKKAIKDNPKDSNSHYILAQDAINKKDYNTAVTELKSAIQNDPNNYLYYYDLGKIQYTQKKYAEASSTFDTCCKKNPDYAPAKYNMGLCQLKLKNDNAALEAFRQTIDMSPRHEKAYLEEARILARRGDYSNSAFAYENVLAINNMNITASMELGSVYYQAKNYSKAEDSYRKALSMLSPSQEQTLTKYNLSTVLYDANKNVEAEKYAKEAYEGVEYLKDNKQKVNLVYNYALLLDRKGDIDNAIPLYMEVLQLNPEHIKTKINLGVMYMNLVPPDVDMAMALFAQVYKADKNNFEANNNLGSAYLEKEDYKNAILYFQNAIKLQPANNSVRANLAKAYAKNSDYDNAKVVYKELIKVDPKNWDGYVELAKVCIQLEDNEGAEKYLVYIQEKNPGYRTAEVESLLTSIK